MASFDHLSTELVGIIFSLLPLNERYRFGRLSKRCYDVSRGFREFRIEEINSKQLYLLATEPEYFHSLIASCNSFKLTHLDWPVCPASFDASQYSQRFWDKIATVTSVNFDMKYKCDRFLRAHREENLLSFQTQPAHHTPSVTADAHSHHHHHHHPHHHHHESQNDDEEGEEEEQEEEDEEEMENMGEHVPSKTAYSSLSSHGSHDPAPPSLHHHPHHPHHQQGDEFHPQSHPHGGHGHGHHHPGHFEHNGHSHSHGQNANQSHSEHNQNNDDHHNHNDHQQNGAQLQKFLAKRKSDLLAAVGRACPLLRKVTFPPKLNSYSNVLFSLLEHFPKLENLQWRLASLHLPTAVSIWTNSPSSSSNEKTEKPSLLPPPPCSFRSLTSLAFHETDLSDTELETIFQVFCPKADRLQSLTFSDCPKISGTCLLELNHRFPNLETLELNFLPALEPNLVHEIVRCLPSTLKKFALDECETFSTSHLEIIGSRCPLLESVGAPPLEFSSDAELVRVMSKFPHLTRFSLFEIVNEGRSLGLISNVFSRLTTVILSGFPDSTDAGVDALASHSPLLKWFDGYECPLTDKAIMSLGVHCKHLQVIDLGRNEFITDSGVFFVFLNCPQLKQVFLSDCDLLTSDILLLAISHLKAIQDFRVAGCPLMTDTNDPHVVDKLVSFSHAFGLSLYAFALPLLRVSQNFTNVFHSFLRNCPALSNLYVPSYTQFASLNLSPPPWLVVKGVEMTALL